MGYYTSLQTSSGETPSNSWFSKSFSRVRTAIPGESPYVDVPELPDAVWRAIEPLTRIFQPEGAENGESFWQAPGTLLASVDAVLAILRSDSTAIEARRIVHEYYTKADFERDLVRLKNELEWVTQRGIPRVRLWMT